MSNKLLTNIEAISYIQSGAIIHSDTLAFQRCYVGGYPKKRTALKNLNGEWVYGKWQYSPIEDIARQDYIYYVIELEENPQQLLDNLRKEKDLLEEKLRKLNIKIHELIY